jgi:hypothetical protein
MEGKKKSGRGPVRKRDLGLVGLLTVALQYGVGVKNDDTTEKAVKAVASQEFAKVERLASQLRLEREQNFVRKADLAQVLAKLDTTMNRVDDRLEAVQKKVSRVEGYLKARRGHDLGKLELDDAGAEVAGR